MRRELPSVPGRPGQRARGGGRGERLPTGAALRRGGRGLRKAHQTGAQTRRNRGRLAGARLARYLLRPVGRGELREVLGAHPAVPVAVQRLKHGPQAGAVLRTPRGLARYGAGLARVRGPGRGPWTHLQRQLARRARA